MRDAAAALTVVFSYHEGVQRYSNNDISLHPGESQGCPGGGGFVGKHLPLEDLNNWGVP